MKALLSLAMGLSFWAAAPSASANEIWFSPQWQVMQPYDSGIRPIDNSALFKPGAPWDVTAAHVAVFKISLHFLKTAGDPALNLVFKGLRERHMKVALEFGILDLAPDEVHIEGFFPEPESARYAINRIKAHGGTLDYISMDEPYWYASVYDKAHARHWPVERIAANAARTFALFKQAFPGVQLGDIEPVIDTPDLAPRYATWIDAMQRALGEPLAFFHLDVVWNKSWRNAFATVVPMLQAKHLPIGIIYNQDFNDASNDHWLAAAQEHYEDLENNGGFVPDQAIFQSWSAMPNRLLPEDAPNTHAHLVLSYLRERMNLTATRKGAALTGTLTDAGGRPMAGVLVCLERSTGKTDAAIWTTRQTASTDAEGRAKFRLSARSLAAAHYRLEFAGDATHRAVRGEVRA